MRVATPTAYDKLLQLLEQQPRPTMHAQHRKVFEFFADYTVAIVGSSVRDFDHANDIDVLFLAQDFRELAKSCGVKYLGKFSSPLTKGDVRRLSGLTIDGVATPVQCISDSSVTTFDQWPHEVLLRDGRRLNEGKHFDKEPT